MITDRIEDTDIVIIGAGISGLVSAYKIKNISNKKIILLSCGHGASPYVHGINIPLGKDDSVECFMRDTLQSGCGLCDETIVEALANDSLSILNLFKDLGIEIDKLNGRYDLLHAVGSTHPRVACSGNNTGAKIIHKLTGFMKEKNGVSFFNSDRALRIDVEGGKVNGVLCYCQETNEFRFIRCKALILASGGFCNLYNFSTNTNDIGGDGIGMSSYAGAALIDLEMIQFEPCVTVFPERVRGKGIVTTMFYDGAVLRNKYGERFMLGYGNAGEKVNKDILSYEIYNEINIGNGTENGGIWFDASGVDKCILENRYQSYLKRYADCGIDISKEFIEIAPAAHTSLGGVRANQNCETNIPGFFVCGEVMGGLHGANRIGGNAGLETLVFGSRAGESVVEYSNSKFDTKIFNNEDWLFKILGQKNKIIDGDEIQKVAVKAKGLLSQTANVIRDLEKSECAANEVKSILDDISSCYCEDKKNKYSLIRLQNDLTCIYLVLLSVSKRKESIGCHRLIKDEGL